MLGITFGGLGSLRLKAIRNRQVVGSTPTLGSSFFNNLRDFLHPVESCFALNLR